MELGEEAELRQTERTSAEKLQTTVGNKRRNYTKRFGKKAFTLADGLYRNLTTALHDYPALATRLGCEPVATLAEREAESLLGKLTPIQRQRLVKKSSKENPPVRIREPPDRPQPDRGPMPLILFMEERSAKVKQLPSRGRSPCRRIRCPSTELWVWNGFATLSSVPVDRERTGNPMISSAGGGT